MILSDNETKVDLLNSEAIAKTVVKLITSRPDHPVTVGVHGDWGAGKSSILEMIEATLSPDKDIVVIKFNGWRFQGFEDAKISLIEEIVTELIHKRSLLTKAKEEVAEIFKRIDWLKVAKKAGGLALTAFTGIPSPEIVSTVLNGIEGFINDPSKTLTKENLSKLVSEGKGLLKEKEDGTKNVPQEIGEFRKAFDKLLAKAGIKQLVVLVDDLDRCLPDTAIETLEAIRLFVFTTKTAFVIAADEGMIEYAVRKHFPDFADTPSAQMYSRNYLEKLIQVPFRIPVLGETETRIYVTLLLVGSEIGENNPAFEKLISEARNRLKKPWEATPLDAQSIRNALGVEASKAQNALLVSEQIGPILASGTKGNPRQIKRFLNTLLLRQSTADARGFGNSILIPVLAKLMIAERFLPRLYEQIATSAAVSADGKCKEIAAFEEELKEAEKPVAKKKSVAKGQDDAEVSTSPEAKFLPEWRSTTEIQDWAKIKPDVGDEDLRPYIFVSKDKKDYFGTSSTLGHLSAIADKLFGQKIAVQALDSQLKTLNPSEARQIFEAIKARLLSSGKFDAQPDGIEGMSKLVKLFPVLQPDLVDFLEGLPENSIGGWIVTGWDSVIVETGQKSRFDKLLTTWSTSSNVKLKTVAASALKMKAK